MMDVLTLGKVPALAVAVDPGWTVDERSDGCVAAKQADISGNSSKDNGVGALDKCSD